MDGQPDRCLIGVCPGDPVSAPGRDIPEQVVHATIITRANRRLKWAAASSSETGTCAFVATVSDESGTAVAVVPEDVYVMSKAQHA
jgi:hypothetical protein